MSSSGFKFKKSYAGYTGQAELGDPLNDGPVTIDDPELVRELRSWARSITRRNPDRTEAVTSRLATLCVRHGRELVRRDLYATVKREGNARNRED